MKLHSKERPNSIEPQLPLQAGSASETSEKRSKKRRHKSKKNTLIEKKINAAHQAVETVIHQNEVRLIWDRGATADEKPVETAKKARTEKPAKKSAKSAPEVAAVEAVIDHAAPATKNKKVAEKPAEIQQVEVPLTSTPEVFSELLDNLALPEHSSLDSIVDEAYARQTLRPETQSATPASAQEKPAAPPPVLPPEAKSYRHFFWNEPSIMSPAEAQAERSMLPTVEQIAPNTAGVSGRTYVESQSSVAKPEKTRKEQGKTSRKSNRKPSAEHVPEPAEPLTSQPETQPQSAEVIDGQPFLEAIPLHDMSEPQLPERMDTAPLTIETVPAFDTPDASAINEVVASAPNLQPQQELGLAELVKLSKRIKIDGVKLHEIFTANRIDEAGLRAVVQAFLRGGNVRKQLTDEILNKEKSYERDPSTRHLTSDQVRDKLANTSVKVVQKSYQLGKTSKKVTREATRVIKDAAVQANQNLRESGIDIHWPSIAAIGIIYTLIIILLLT